MTNDNQRYETRTTAESGRQGPNLALILLGIVFVLGLIFFLRNGDPLKLDFLVFNKRTTVRWSIIVSIVVGILLDRLFTIWWRRSRRR